MCGAEVQECCAGTYFPIMCANLLTEIGNINKSLEA